MPTPNRVKANAHMGRLLKRRAGEKKAKPPGHLMTFKFWVSMCCEYQPIKSKLLQMKDRGTE
jgi:hypothetical protein